MTGVATALDSRVAVITQAALDVVVSSSRGRSAMTGTSSVCMTATTMPLKARTGTSPLAVGVVAAGEAGTTLVEALHRGRRAIGVEYETRWADLARTNIDLAYGAGIDLDAAVYQGDARKLPTLLPADLRGQVDLVITSPPYGDSTHGHVRVKPGEGVRKYDHRYGAVLDRGNLANVGIGRLLTGFTRILTGVADYLKPGGHVVITARPWRQHAELIDLPTHITTCGTLAGLTPVERCVALLGRLADDDIIARSSFFQRDFIVKNRRGGLPVHLIAHEDVIVLERRDVPDSLQLKQTHPNRSLVSTAAWVDRKWAA